MSGHASQAEAPSFRPQPDTCLDESYAGIASTGLGPGWHPLQLFQYCAACSVHSRTRYYALDLTWRGGRGLSMGPGLYHSSGLQGHMSFITLF